MILNSKFTPKVENISANLETRLNTDPRYSWRRKREKAKDMASTGKAPSSILLFLLLILLVLCATQISMTIAATTMSSSATSESLFTTATNFLNLPAETKKDGSGGGAARRRRARHVDEEQHEQEQKAEHSHRQNSMDAIHTGQAAKLHEGPLAAATAVNGGGGGGGGGGASTNGAKLQHGQKVPYGDCCECWSASDGLNMEVECSCCTLKENLTLAPNVHRITVQNSKNFTTLSNELIRPFAASLLEIILSDLPEFSAIQDNAFVGMANLRTIYILGAPSLKNISRDVFKGFLPKLKSIKIVHTGLEHTPNFNQLFTLSHLDSLDLENNKIASIQPGWIDKLKVDQLTLSYNQLEVIPAHAFNGSTIAGLTLEGNLRLRQLDQDAFVGIEELSLLDLSKTSITVLPTRGLKRLEILRVQHTWTLTVIPSIYHFQHLKEAYLTYPYHCCAFHNPVAHDPVAHHKVKESFQKLREEYCNPPSTPSPPSSSFSPSSEGSESLPTTTSPDPSISTNSIRHHRNRRDYYSSSTPSSSSSSPAESSAERSASTGVTSAASFGGLLHPSDFSDFNGFSGALSDLSTYSPPFQNVLFAPDSAAGGVGGGSSSRSSSGGNSGPSHEFGTFHPDGSVTLAPPILEICNENASTDADYNQLMVRSYPRVKCSPEPDAFSPCEDIMGNMWLRVAVWIVVTLALVGNAAVLVVLILTPGRMSVQRFLMANLSFADLSMGVYLMMVAIEDLVSLGTYFNHAIDWQLGWGCQLAGFLTVFASELSVFTLAVITGERWYALTRAIHLTKRLTIKGAAKLMVFGWILAINLASLPLLGVSSYSKTSICLPMEATSSIAVTYLAFLLVFNGLAFVMVAYAYWQMYRTVAGHNAPATQSADLAIAKKMGLLVFTDFVCWAPVAFFGLTAVGGHPLIGVTDAKILLVFFYPLNSFCNPYLYAILTKQYRRDLYHLLHRHGICTEAVNRIRTSGGAAQSTNNTMQTMHTVMRINSITDHQHHRHSSTHRHSARSNNNPLQKFSYSWKDKSAGGRNNDVEYVAPAPSTNNNKRSKETVILPIQQSTGHCSSSSERNGGIDDERICDSAGPPSTRIQEESYTLARMISTESSEDYQDCVSGDRNSSVETAFVSVPNSARKNNGQVGQSLLEQRKDKSEDLVEPEVTESTPFCPSGTLMG